jgi:hypothetical protein
MEAQPFEAICVSACRLGLHVAQGIKMNEVKFKAAVRSARASTAVLSATLFIFLAAAGPGQAQGIVRGAQEGAHEGNRVAGPVGGVVGGAVGAGVGGAVGAVEGVLGVPHRGYRCHGYYRHGHYHCYR